jgi:hypothetical protein
MQSAYGPVHAHGYYDATSVHRLDTGVKGIGRVNTARARVIGDHGQRRGGVIKAAKLGLGILN